MPSTPDAVTSRPSSLRTRARRLASAVVALALAGLSGFDPSLAQAPMPAAAPTAEVRPRLVRLGEGEIRQWLTYLSSDLLQGRAVFTEGYGLAAAYIADQLRAMGVTPLGDEGTYFQAIAQTTYDVSQHSSFSIGEGDDNVAFADGTHVEFPADSGTPQTLTFSSLVFAGAGPAPESDAGAPPAIDVAGKLVLYMPDLDTREAGRGRSRRSYIAARSDRLIAQGAAAVIALVPAGEGRSAPTTRVRSSEEGANRTTRVTKLGRIDRPRAPRLTADETVFARALAAGPFPLERLQAMARQGETLPVFAVPNVPVTIDVDNRYTLATEQLTENVVGLVEGTDPVLRDTYVFFGAHLDHVGYASGSEPKGQVNTPLTSDRIWNGADDDGSGSSALLAIAKAFVTGPRPRRSVVFVWHAGEEPGLIGSRYMAEHPVVPIDRIQAQLNIDMIGRNRDDDPRESNTVYVIGADRISTDLHNLIVEANAEQDRPLTLDYEYNDEKDPNQFYVRSDHYSYASKGIPIAFFFTGTHPDYHANTDTVDKILFPKLVRIAQMIYTTGFEIANRETPLVRDNRGSRSGKGFSGRLPEP